MLLNAHEKQCLDMWETLGSMLKVVAFTTSFISSIFDLVDISWFHQELCGFGSACFLVIYLTDFLAANLQSD